MTSSSEELSDKTDKHNDYVFKESKSLHPKTFITGMTRIYSVTKSKSLRADYLNK